MSKNTIIEFKAAAEQFRNRQQHSQDSLEEDLSEEEDLEEEDLEEEDLEEEDLEEEDLEEEDLEEEETYSESTDPESKQIALYMSKDVKIYFSHIEIDNHIHAISYIASTKRIEKKPPIYECMLSMGFVVISILALITYLVMGKLKLGLLAVVYLSMILIAFLTLSIICQQLKSTFSLELYNFQGEVVDKISTLSKSVVGKIEKALKTAIAARA